LGIGQVSGGKGGTKGRRNTNWQMGKKPAGKNAPGADFGHTVLERVWWDGREEAGDGKRKKPKEKGNAKKTAKTIAKPSQGKTGEKENEKTPLRVRGPSNKQVANEPNRVRHIKNGGTKRTPCPKSGGAEKPKNKGEPTRGTSGIACSQVKMRGKKKE